MLVEANKETLCINQIVGQKSDSIIVEEDFVVPDIKPDILNSINTSGNVCVYKKEILDGKVRIDGSVNAYIMYLADNQEGQIRSINTNLDFSQTIDLDGITESMLLKSDIKIKQIECRVLNGRKINVKALLDINLTVYSNESIDFINGINDMEDLQLLKDSIQINSLLGEGKTKAYAKDTVVIDSIDEIAEIMKTDIEIKNKETKISYNKILIKSDACIKIMYLTTDNRICLKDAAIPIIGFIDMPNVSDDNICDIDYEIKNILIKPNSIEEHSIYVEIEVLVSSCCYETKKLEIIQDLYSPSKDLTYSQKMINAMVKKQCISDMCPIREKQFISELRGNKIYDVNVKPYIVSQKIIDDRIIFEGSVALDFIFEADNTSHISVEEVIVPFEYNMSYPGIEQNSKINVNMEVQTQDFIVMPDESIDIKIDLQFIVDSSNSRQINLIQQVDEEENRDIQKCSLTIYFVKAGDTLWKIAKRFKSTVDDIAKLNGIEDKNVINIGEQLFIPMH